MLYGITHRGSRSSEGWKPGKNINHYYQLLIFNVQLSGNKKYSDNRFE